MATNYKVLIPRAEIGTLPEGLTVKKTYNAFSIVSASDDAIAELNARYPVEKLDPTPASTAHNDVFGLAHSREHTGTEAREFVVQFGMPVEEDWKRKLEAAGLTIRRSLGASALIVTTDNPTALTKASNLDEVEQIDPYTPVFRISNRFLQGLDVSPTKEAIAEAQLTATTNQSTSSDRRLVAPGILMASFFTPEDRNHAAEVLDRQGVRVTQRVGDRRLLLSVADAENALEALNKIAAQPGLRIVEEQPIKTVSNNVARALIGAGVVSANFSGLSLTGKEEIVAIADTGLDTGNETTLHRDFKGRLRFIKSYPITQTYSNLVTNPGADDGPADLYSGHGTHVSGSVLGDGAQAESLGLSPIAGMAPEAELVFQAIEQTPKWTVNAVLSFLSQGKKPPVSGLLGIPPNLRDLFAEAYAQGARIHSNSWGGGTPGDYDLQCEDLDRFVWEHPDFLVLVAAGNSGTNSSAASPAIDPMSVDSPGTAKNALTIGACENARSGEFSDTYGAWWPSKFPNSPFNKDQMVDSPNDVVAFSSRGPCATGRRKPDLIAPGTFILSTRSSQIATNNFAWAPYPAAKDHYMFMGGTSMATPLVAGSAALVREYLRKSKHIATPSAALLKASLIHSAQYNKYRYSHESSAAEADNEQGWGRIELSKILSPTAPTNVIFRDENTELTTGDEESFACEIDDAETPLRVTLVYTDYPSDISTNGALVNNLNLVVVSPSGKFYLGNDFKQEGTPDKVNNVEGVVIRSPEIGKWTIRIVASEVQEERQRFAVVLSGGGLVLV